MLCFLLLNTRVEKLPRRNLPKLPLTDPTKPPPVPTARTNGRHLLWLRIEATSSKPTASETAETLSKNALRRLERNQKKRKEEKRASNAAENRPAPSNRSASVDEEDMDPTQYLEKRHRYLAAQKTEGNNPYPHKFSVSMSIDQYINKYGGLSNGEHLEDVSVSLAGRIMHKRSSGAKLVFYGLHGGGFKVQVMADARRIDMIEELEKITGLSIPKDLSSEDANEYLKNVC